MARYEFMQETLVEILRGLSGVQVVASADVFSACRSLKYQLREAERVAGVQQQGVADAHVAAMRAAQLAAERVRGTPPLMPTEPYPMGCRPLMRSTPLLAGSLSQWWRFF